ncbi:uncharacterized protein ACMZJ9_007476 [Mantella aurantiaca]
MSITVPKYNPTTARWDEQVEKALDLPSDWIFNTEDKMQIYDTNISIKGSRREIKLTQKIWSSLEEMSPQDSLSSKGKMSISNSPIDPPPFCFSDIFSIYRHGEELQGETSRHFGLRPRYAIISYTSSLSTARTFSPFDIENYKNVALQGRATQSNNYETLSSATNAIDGNLDAEYAHGSCFSSKSQLSPWWRVDLLASHEISHIMITSRGDCCADYLNGAEILVGDSLANNGNNNSRCAQITAIPQGATQTFNCFDMKGRYVNVILPGKTGYLTFCEIQIYGVPVTDNESCACAKKYKNVALQGRATQSTNYETLSSATNAIDGNLEAEYAHGSCFSSKSQLSPWWRVDLLASHEISHIMITSRGDCCADYLNGAEILVGDSLANNGNNNSRCAQITAIPQGATQTFNCFDMKGRYVNVILPGKTGYLTFCEIQIYGVPVTDDESCARAKKCSNNDDL